ncbi:unnamed protein product [Symbiodinium microadriaticum]|nr:unnamed protein product [Symbiodinium microadriaticum]
MTVTVGSGASVRNVLNALSAYGLTLENFSSIQEQQMAGWTQVAAHGTGCGLPTVEEQIVEMKIATPAEGILTLSDAKLPRLYRLAKVGLGSVGVVTELTLRCIPKLNLKEDTIVLQRDDVSDGHYDRLRQCRHVRYMWIPYTSCVVSVTSNPAPNVKRVNQAEAKYWEASQGSRVGDSTDILGFDCGGEQWVLEMCFPIGSLDEETYADVSFVRELLELVEMEGIPAPGPIEQRWTARSTSPMSPAFSENPKEKFCWVGVIMYTPASQTQEQREDIRRAFVRYCKALDPLLLKYKAQLHWAKLEPPLLGNHTSPSGSEIHLMRERIHSKYPVDEFKSVRNVLDPKGILSNSLVETFLN